MTYKNLQDEVIALRFAEANRASVKSWLNVRYAALWAKADWHFKHVRGASLTVTASDPTPTMPSDFAKSEGLYDSNGSPLIYLTPRQFDEESLPNTSSSSSTSSYFTVVDRELWLSPAPGGTATYTLSYLRRLSHVDGASGLAAAGIMSADSDQPIWEAEYDYLLVLDAAVLGGTLLDDLGVDAIKSERDDLLASMIDDLVGGQRGEFQQWGGTGGDYFGTAYGGTW